MNDVQSLKLLLLYELHSQYTLHNVQVVIKD